MWRHIPTIRSEEYRVPSSIMFGEEVNGNGTIIPLYRDWCRSQWATSSPLVSWRSTPITTLGMLIMTRRRFMWIIPIANRKFISLPPMSMRYFRSGACQWVMISSGTSWMPIWWTLLIRIVSPISFRQPQPSRSLASRRKPPSWSSWWKTMWNLANHPHHWVRWHRLSSSMSILSIVNC